MSAEEKKKIPITRKCFSIEEKNSIIRLLEAGESNASVSKKFGVSHSTISSIKKNKHKIETLYKSNILKRKRMRTSTQEQVDKVLLKWFKLKHKQGILVTGPMLQEKANFFAKQLKIEPAFYCSASWIHRFKVRHNIINGKIDKDALSDVRSGLNEDLENVDTESSDYERFNYEEAELIHKLTPEITLNFKSDECTEINIPKESTNIEIELDNSEVLGNMINSCNELQSFPIEYKSNGKAKTSEVFIKLESQDSDDSKKSEISLIPCASDALKAAEVLKLFVQSNFHDDTLQVKMSCIYNAVKQFFVLHNNQ